jgi:dienelactone hydrolase
MWRMVAGLCLLFFCANAGGATDGQLLLRDAAAAAIKIVPTTEPATDFAAPGVRAFFFAAPPWHGKATRVFAWYGLPTDFAPDRKVPAMLLVHGGGGTAFASWVRLWNKRGYAALAIDTCGQLPRGNPRQRDEHGGPPGWGGFDQVADSVEDQWPFHAELDVILADSLLRSFPEVDTNRVGIVGISWGGYLTCLASELDPRFKFAISVYGCGFLGDDSAWLPQFAKMGPERAAAWLHAFDPSEYLPDTTIPMLWVDGTNDLNYPFESLRKSYLLPKGPRTLVTRVRMKHSHSAGWAPEEIYVYADSQCRSGAPLAVITQSGAKDGIAWSIYTSSSPVSKAELDFTLDAGDWKKRKWETAAATVEASASKVSASLPTATTAWFFNLTDERGLLVSSEMTATQ